ncbi:hypothetical protein V6N12_015407 [Hibiscus sabdariffa]|uniref:J domain-containing protein n=1 Tax=Hibiscus sabdariffa TaxID=183260 RepID=A0ABR2DNH6_9ROSI
MEPPFNFSMVDIGIYRSGCPRPSNFAFLETLNLHSIIYLCPEPYPEENMKFLGTHNIKLFQFGIEGKTQTSVAAPKDAIRGALKILIGKKLQNWCLFSVIDEYQRFSGVKSRATDVIFIEMFDATCLRQSFNSTIFLHQIYGTGKRQSLYRENHGQLPSASSSENLQHTYVNHQFYGTSCQNESATAGTQAPFSLLRSGSVPVGAYALQRENEFLERPGQLECQFYMKTGDYKFGAVCWVHHTRERVLPAPDCVLSPIGLPLCPAMLVHPDKNMGSPLASEAFKKLQCAYEVLSDSMKKRGYDEQLRKEESRTRSVSKVP